MASGFGGIFDDPRQGRNQMAAPGLHPSVFSGNPAATTANLSAVAGATAGAGLIGAFGSLLGTQTVNPAQMAQQRQAAFAQKYQQVMADGQVMQGDALRQAADEQHQAGLLSPQEYLRAIGVASTQSEKDRKQLSDAVSFVNKNESVQNYRESKSIHDEMRRMAMRDPSTSDDFALIQMGLKVLDPGSVVSQNELASGRMSVIGEQALNVIGFDVNQLINWAAYGGEKPTFTAEQKKKWLETIGSRVDAQATAASQVYAAGREQYLAGGGVAGAFDNATQTLFESFTGPATSVMVQDESGNYSSGTMRPLTGRLDAAKDFVLGQLASPQPGRNKLKVGNEFLGVDIDRDSPAGWIAENILGMGGSDPMGPTAALAVTPGAVNSALKDTWGFGGTFGLVWDFVNGSPATGPLNDYVQRGAQEFLFNQNKMRSPAQIKRQKERAAKRRIYPFGQPSNRAR